MSTIIKDLIEAKGLYMSARARYTLILQEMKSSGVRFSDLGPFLFKKAKEEGLWSNEESLRRAKMLNLEWHRSIILFLEWVERNYKGYDEKKETRGRDVRLKGGKIVVTRKKKEKKKKEKTAKKADKEKTTKEATKEAAKEKTTKEAAKKTVLTAEALEEWIKTADNLSAVISQLESMGYKITPPEE